MEPEPEGDLAERRECYKLVLDRYQTFLSFCADMSLKCLMIGFGFYGFFFAVHKDSGPKSVPGIDCKTRVMILVVAALQLDAVQILETCDTSLRLPAVRTEKGKNAISRRTRDFN